MKSKTKLTLLVLTTLLMSMIPMVSGAVVEVWFLENVYGDAPAEWSTDQKSSGAYSAKLASEEVGAFSLVVLEGLDIALGDLATLSFDYYLDVDHFDGVYPAIYVELDTDSEPDTWEMELVLRASWVGVDAADVTEEEWHTWTTSVYNDWHMTGDDGEHTLAEALIQLDGEVPDYTIVALRVAGVGNGGDDIVYIDNIRINDYTYDLEEGGVSVTSTVGPATVSISVSATAVAFGNIVFGGSSNVLTVDVTNNGDISVTVSADISDQFYKDHLIMGVAPDILSYSAPWAEEIIIKDGSATYSLQLVAVDDVGVHSGVLVFSATPVAPGTG